MKKILLIVMVVFTLTDCKKQENTTPVQKISSTTTTAYKSPLTGTWVNSQDVTDYFSINDTTWVGCTACYHEIIIHGAGKYLGTSNNEYAKDTMITYAPGLQRDYLAPNGIFYTDHIYYTGGIIKIQIDGYPTAGVSTTLIFNKQ